jgi:mono/diheme cytochrome c family protein
LLGDWLMARTTNRSARVLVAAACFGALAIGGCGGSKTTATTGKQIFSDAGCGGCHTYIAAGSKGSSGPNLDDVGPTEAEATKQITEGGGGMPAFGGDLTPQQISAVAKFVSGADDQ